MMAGQNTRVNSLSGPTNNGADARFLTSREPTAGKFLDNACHNRSDRRAHSWWNFTVRQPSTAAPWMRQTLRRRDARVDLARLQPFSAL